MTTVNFGLKKLNQFSMTILKMAALFLTAMYQQEFSVIR